MPTRNIRRVASSDLAGFTQSRWLSFVFQRRELQGVFCSFRLAIWRCHFFSLEKTLSGFLSKRHLRSDFTTTADAVLTHNIRRMASSDLAGFTHLRWLSFVFQRRGLQGVFCSLRPAIWRYHFFSLEKALSGLLSKRLLRSGFTATADAVLTHNMRRVASSDLAGFTHLR